MTEDIAKAQGQQPPIPNPALQDLEVFVGNWHVELSRTSFLSNPSATANGFASEWQEKGAYLVIRQGDKQSPPFSTWIIGRDESTETYKLFYFDTWAVSRIYDMSFQGGVWKLWRKAPGHCQRFTGIFSEDGKHITACWEKSRTGNIWEPDFDLTYSKIC